MLHIAMSDFGACTSVHPGKSAWMMQLEKSSIVILTSDTKWAPASIKLAWRLMSVQVPPS